MAKNLFDSTLHRLRAAYDEGEARAIARYVLEVRFGVTQTDICMGKDRQISAEERGNLENIIDRLLQKEPVQYVLGRADFFGRTFHVTPDVLIPRPETEELVQWILDNRDMSAAPRILDIGTGSGCIAISLCKEIAEARVYALDISAGALSIARRNAETHRADITFLQQDILKCDNTSLPGPWDIIVSNPPYICLSEQAEMESNVLNHEPHGALFVPDRRPLLFYEAIGEYARKTLRPQGWLYVEINRSYGPETVELFRGMGFENIELRQDLCGNDRMIRCRK